MSHAAVRGLEDAREFLPGRLYFLTSDRAPLANPDVHYFSIANVFVYINFYMDFGPNCISHILRFCDLVNGKLAHPELRGKRVCLFSTNEPDKRSNAAFLLCAYMLIVHRRVPEEAFKPLLGMGAPFVPYRDAGYGQATYHITIPDCLRGLNRALQLGLFNLDTFNLEEYEFYEKVENGDMNWICDKFLALASPKDDPAKHPYDLRNKGTAVAATRGAGAAGGWGFGTTTASQSKPDAATQLPTLPVQRPLRSAYYMGELAQLLHDKGVSTIIHLNKEQYDIQPLVEKGIEHIDLYFPDGTTPPEPLLMKFLEIVESRPGPIAIHCKAGLGRTGTLIACYLMKHYMLTAAEVISYLRLVRPGSVVGPQQNFLQGLQPSLWQLNPETPLPVEYSLLRPTNWPECNRYPLKDAIPLQPSIGRPLSFSVQSQSALLQEQHRLVMQAHKPVDTEQLRLAAETAVPVQPRKDSQGRLEEEKLRGLRNGNALPSNIIVVGASSSEASALSPTAKSYDYRSVKGSVGDASFVPRGIVSDQDEQQQYEAAELTATERPSLYNV